MPSRTYEDHSGSIATNTIQYNSHNSALPERFRYSKQTKENLLSDLFNFEPSKRAKIDANYEDYYSEHKKSPIFT